VSAQVEASKPASQVVNNFLKLRPPQQSSSVSQSTVMLHRMAAFCFAH
jgi:hypothetical protein